MLRVAMRLTKVDDATAKTYAAKAFANGVITSNDDNCMLMHAGGVTTNDSSEPYAKIIVHEDPGVAFINTTFLDLLKSTNDPRIPLFMCVYPTDYETKDVDPAKADNAAPALQKAPHQTTLSRSTTEQSLPMRFFLTRTALTTTRRLTHSPTAQPTATPQVLRSYAQLPRPTCCLQRLLSVATSAATQRLSMRLVCVAP